MGYLLLIMGGLILICFAIAGLCDLLGAASSGGFENWEKEKQRMNEIEKIKREEEAERQARIKRANACPVCGSTNWERITYSSRSWDVGLNGYAAKSIGKQYKCLDCKHMW